MIVKLEQNPAEKIGKPKALIVDWEKIPRDMQYNKQWVSWQYEYSSNANKPWTKVPYDCYSKFKASTRNSDTWNTFQKLRKCFQSTPHFDGIGYVLQKGEVGIDLDDCIDPNGKLADWAKAIVSEINSYTEVSPSGTGIRIFCLAEFDESWWEGRYRKKQKIEIYDYTSPRYLTVTGRHLKGLPSSRQVRQHQVARFHSKFLGMKLKTKALLKNTQKPIQDTDYDVDRIVEKASTAANGATFKKLFQGYWEDLNIGDGSQSAADLALCSLIAFWTGDDPDYVDAVFRTSGLYRDKWERDDYREQTLSLGLDREEFFEWLPEVDMEKIHTVYKNKATEKPAKSVEKPDQIQQLLDLVADIELWKTPDSITFATVQVEDHLEHHRINSLAFNHWLRLMHLHQHGRSPKKTALEEAIATIDARALSSNQIHETYLRVARTKNAIFVDLCNENWQAVQITPQGWKVVDAPKIKFIRNNNMAALPKPVAGGKIEELRKLLNVEANDFPLVVGFLLDALKGRGPYLVQIIGGEQGSSKSVFCESMKRILDPSVIAPLQSLPKNLEDLAVSALNEYMLGFDNVSHLQTWLSDGICRVATGSGLKTRKLYQQTEQQVYGFARPTCLNGIPDFASNADLLSRAMVLQLPKITEENRKDVVQVWREFESALPKVLGVLYEAVSSGLKRLEVIRAKGKKLPRMADSALWITACMESMGWEEDTFLESFKLNQQESVETNLEGWAMFDAFSNWYQNYRSMVKKELWEGSPGELLTLLKLEEDNYFNWPTSGKGMSNQLRRNAPALREVGYEIVWTDKVYRGRKLIQISQIQFNNVVT